MTTKNPTVWIPQPLGQGYVTTVASNVLVDKTGRVLINGTGRAIATSTTQITGKAKTVWSNTGV